MKSLFFSTSNDIFLLLLSFLFSPFDRQTSLSISISHSTFLFNHAFLLKPFSQLTTLNVHFKHISFFMSTILYFNAPKSHSIIIITSIFTFFFAILSLKSFSKTAKYIPCSQNSLFPHFRHLSSFCLFKLILFLISQ